MCPYWVAYECVGNLAVLHLLLQGLIVAFEKKGLNVAKGVNPRCVRQCLTTLPFPDYDAWVHKSLGMRLVSTVLC